MSNLRGVSAGLVVAAALVVTSCGDADGQAAQGAPSGTLLVFAAASLADAFAQIETEFERAHPAVDVRLNLAASSALREQILEGAPADVYASADPDNVERLAVAGETAAAAEVFAVNSMTLVVPAGNPGAVTSAADLTRSDLLVGLCSATVPCGGLADRVLGDLGVTASVDTREPNVRSLLTKLIEGELDAGLVYTSDALSAGSDVEEVPLDAGVLVTRYPIVTLVDAPNPTAAQLFMAFVLSPDGQRTLAAHGFVAP